MRPTPTLLAGLSLALVASFATACSSGDDAEKSPRSAPPTSAGPAAPATEPLDLSLLVFNVEYGGSRSTDAVMKDVHADVVSVLESYNRLPEIARKAGYPYYDVGLQILSKYPILEASDARGLYALIEVRPGEAVALVNTHLDYVKDGPNRLDRGVPVADVVATEKQVRLSSIDKLLPSATRLMKAGWPVLLTGDLNEPSHLDWTAATASQHHGVGAVDWPVSEAVLGTGMKDAFREVHPDPVTVPGNTWGGVAGSKGSPRRIDFAYLGGPVQVRTSEVVGEKGGPGVDRGYPRWTSDHRAVLSQLRVTPSAIPTTVALSSRMLTVGQPVTVTWRMPPGVDTGRIRLTGASSVSYDVSGSSGTLRVPTASLEPGDYLVDLDDTDDAPMVSNQLHLRPKDARVALATDAHSYAVGQPISVRWADGPANRWDWIGVFKAGHDATEKDDYLVWGYTGGHDAGALPPTTDGELVLGPDHQGSPWPLPRGRYVAHYLLTDQYKSIGKVAFTVR
jgi:endonuclease/exonuclease/phosphatase family metal-dependent hydrolase